MEIALDRGAAEPHEPLFGTACLACPLARTLRRFAGEITTQYVMRYTPDVTEKSAARQYRRIVVTVKPNGIELPNVTIRYRPGYYPFGPPSP